MRAERKGGRWWRRARATEDPKPRLKKREIGVWLEARGWLLQNFFVDGIDFIALKGATRVAVGLQRGELTMKRLQDAGKARAIHRCFCLLVVDTPPKPHILKEADERFVTIIDVGELPDALLSLASRADAGRRRFRDRYAAIKHKLRQTEDAGDGESTQEPLGEDRLLIYRSTYTEVIVHRGHGQNALIGFEDIDDHWMLDNWGMAASRAFCGGYVHVRARTANWYPAHDASKWVPLARDWLDRQGFERRWAFGCRQGGYGALRHGASLGCNRVVAIAPVSTIDPWEIEDARFSKYFREDLHYGMLLQLAHLAAEVIVICDPYDEADQAQQAALARQESTRFFAACYAADALSWLFKKDEVIATTISLCQNDDWAGLQALCSRLSRGIPDRAFNLAFALTERRPSLSSRIFLKYGTASNALVQRWSSICYRLAKAQRAGDVLPFLQRAVEEFRTDPAFCATVALVALEAGDLHLASVSIDASLAIAPMNETYLWIRRRTTEEGLTRPQQA